MTSILYSDETIKRLLKRINIAGYLIVGLGPVIFYGLILYIYYNMEHSGPAIPLTIQPFEFHYGTLGWAIMLLIGIVKYHKVIIVWKNGLARWGTLLMFKRSVMRRIIMVFVLCNLHNIYGIIDFLITKDWTNIIMWYGMGIATFLLIKPGIESLTELLNRTGSPFEK